MNLLPRQAPWMLLTAALAILPALACPAAPADGEALTVQVGDAIQLPLNPENSGVRGSCESHDPAIAQVFHNGWCFGINAGLTEVEFRRAGQSEVARRFRIHVKPAESRAPLPASSFQQFPDNRSFRTKDGRQCYGSELNSRQADAKGTKSNRVVNPNPIGNEILWLVEKDARIVDGAGTLIGTIVPRTAGGEMLYQSRFNHGMTKVIGGEIHVYAFAAHIRRGSDGASVGVSAWMPLRQVIDKETLLDRLHPGTGRLPAVELGSETLSITGGNPNDYKTEDGVPFKIVKNINTPPKAIDYLVRDAGTVNILYCVPGFGLGGHALDSYLVSNAPTFSPAQDIRKITVPTYYPPGHFAAGQPTPKPMTFVFGAVKVKDQPATYGWVAEAALATSK